MKKSLIMLALLAMETSFAGAQNNDDMNNLAQKAVEQ